MRKAEQGHVSRREPMQARLAGTVPSLEELIELKRKRLEADKVNVNFLKWKLKVFDKLADRGNQDIILGLMTLLLACDVDHAIECLWMCSDDPNRPHQDNWNHLLGLGYQDFDDVAKLFRRSATQLKKIVGGHLARAFIFSKWKQVELERTVQILESCAQFLSDSHSEAKQATLKKRPTSVAYRAALIAHVIKRTGKMHDQELSNLYNLAIGKRIEQDSWVRWRKKPQNRQLIEKYRS
jgi:hypothetical protein